MIILNINKNAFTSCNHEIIHSENILSKINELVDIDPKENFNLVSLFRLLDQYPDLFLIYPDLIKIKENIFNILSLNQDQSVDGLLKIAERYDITPIISEKDYGETITPYMNINKRYVMYYVNSKEEQMKIERVELKHIINTKIIISDKENKFINMLNNSDIIDKREGIITLNNLLLLISKVDFFI